MAEWIVIHKDENNVLDSVRPLNLEFGLVLKDASDISYDVSLAHPTMRWGFVGPKRSTYELYRDGSLITAGIHSMVNTKKGEEVLHVQGKSWMWYLQNRHYPFDPLAPNTFLGGTAVEDAGIAYQRIGTPWSIIQDMFDAIFARPHGNPFGLETLLDVFSFVSPNVGFRLELGDTQSIYDIMLTLSESELAGFDFWDSPDKVIHVENPERFPEEARTDPNSCNWVLDGYIHPTPFIDAEFENTGPEMTHILGLGSGTATRIGRAYGDEQTQARFGRWDGTVDFAETMNQDQLARKTKIHFSKAAYPARHIGLTVDVENIPDFYFNFYPGAAIWVRENWESNSSNNGYVIRRMTVKVSNQGDEVCELDLEEINQSGLFGGVQG